MGESKKRKLEKKTYAKEIILIVIIMLVFYGYKQAYPGVTYIEDTGNETDNYALCDKAQAIECNKEFLCKNIILERKTRMLFCDNGRCVCSSSTIFPPHN